MLKISQQHLEKGIAWLKFITARLYKYQTLYSYYCTCAIKNVSHRKLVPCNRTQKYLCVPLSYFHTRFKIKLFSKLHAKACSNIYKKILFCTLFCAEK